MFEHQVEQQTRMARGKNYYSSRSPTPGRVEQNKFSAPLGNVRGRQEHES